MPTTIAIIFYAYTSITGHSILAIDISTFAIAAAVGQLISYGIITSKPISIPFNRFGIAIILILGAADVVFTYLPPHLGIFLDKAAGHYGIIM